MQPNRIALAFLAASSLMAVEAPPNQLPQGGGVIYPAWTSHFWSNTELSGAPAYTRSDIRVAFDWEDWRPILGVRAESVRDFPRENISARFTGRIIARFAETYTFHLTSDDQARLRIREGDTGEWRTLIDAWDPHGRRTDTATLAMRPGVNYGIEIDYVQREGDAVCELKWSSPSTPLEVVDYVSGSSVHFMIPQTLADLWSFAGTVENSASAQGTPVDAIGWPTADFSETLIQGNSHLAGRLLLTFRGSAEVQASGTFIAGEKTFTGTLPKGAGYDPATNITRVFLDVPPDGDGETAKTRVMFSKTQRTPDSPVGSGVTDIAIMSPRQVNGKDPHEPGEIIHQEARDAFLPIFSFRVQRTGLNEIEKWSERTLPSYPKIIGQTWRADMAYEKLILAANELGRDLHLCYSDSADEEFMLNLAKLMRYGSDGVLPYDKPTPNPVWPPLNPNLRLLLEHGNEMGWSAIQPRRWSATYEREIHGKDSHPAWKVINFDGQATSDRNLGLMRFHAYRTVMMSDAMRAVWGDDAIGGRIRPMLFGQYERWFQNGLVQFIHDYYNNPKHVAQPRPVSRILWASGPAVYYGTTNNYAVGDSEILANGNFESIDLGPGQVVLRPSVPGWTFTGNAGIIDTRLERLNGARLAAAEGEFKPSKPSLVGFRFTVGDRDIYLHQLGRYAQAGESGTTNTHLYDLEGNAVYPSKHVVMNLGKASAGDLLLTTTDHCGWATSDSSRGGAWRLLKGQSYILVTEVGTTALPGGSSRIEAGPGISIDGPVYIEGGRLNQNRVPYKPESFTAQAGRGFPLPTFLYNFADTESLPGTALMPSDPLVEPTWERGGKGKSFIPPSHRSGTRMAFIAGKGSLTQEFTIEKAGEYMLIFTANSSLNDPKSREGELRFSVRIGSEVAWNNTVGDSRKPKGGLFQWGTRYVHLEPGRHTLTIDSQDANPMEVVYFYAMHLGSIDDFAGGPEARNFLGAGAATGQTEGEFAMFAQLCTAMAQNWGLVPYAYEGGTSAGGDWGGGKLEYAHQFKWEHPWSKAADNQWANFWHNFGGANAFYYYPGFEYKYIHEAETYMPWAAAIDRAHTWVLEPRGPQAAPLTFTTEQLHYQSEPGNTWRDWHHPFLNARQYGANSPKLTKEGMWKGTVFRAPQARVYTISVTTAGTGSVRLIVNDSQRIVQGDAGQPLKTEVFLTQAVHSFRVEALSGTPELVSVRIE